MQLQNITASNISIGLGRDYASDTIPPNGIVTVPYDRVAEDGISAAIALAKAKEIAIVTGPEASRLLQPTNVPGNLLIGLGNLSAADGVTITIGNTIYELDSNSAITAGHTAVTIAGTSAGTAANLKAAINADPSTALLGVIATDIVNVSTNVASLTVILPDILPVASLTNSVSAGQTVLTVTPQAFVQSYAQRTFAGALPFAVALASVTTSAAGTGYTSVPAIGFSGGGGSGAAANAVLKVVSASVAAGGTGGTAGTQTVTGTTGTGTPFQASVTVSVGGAITAVLSITVGGAYTVAPTLVSQPVTGAGLSNAALTVVLGVGAISLTNAGSGYSTAPTVAVTGGGGTGGTATAVLSSGSGAGQSFVTNLSQINTLFLIVRDATGKVVAFDGEAIVSGGTVLVTNTGSVNLAAGDVLSLLAIGNP